MRQSLRKVTHWTFRLLGIAWISTAILTLPADAQGHDRKKAFVSVTPHDLKFGSLIVDTSSTAQRAKLRNAGPGTVKISRIVAHGDFRQTNNCRSELKAGNSCTISVFFEPTATGLRTGILSIDDRASNSPQKVKLTGTGIILTSIAISPASFSLKVGKTLQLTATGTFSDGSTRNLTSEAKWTSSNTSVATVSNVLGRKGLVAGVGVGLVTFNASRASFPGGGLITGTGVRGPVQPPVPRFAYVANQGDNTVSLYTLDATTGLLRDAGYALTGSQPRGVAVDPFGRFAYVVNASDNTVSPYTIDATTGRLTQSEAAVSVGSSPNPAIVDPLGRFLYVPNTDSANISAFTIDQSTGVLTAVSGSPFSIGSNPVSLATTPDGNFLYVVIGDDMVSAFSINASGALTQVGSPVATGTDAFFMAVDPLGRFAYVTNTTSNSVSAYTINSSTGALTAVPGSPFASGAEPIGITVDPSGRFVYVANSGDNTISAYTISSSTGALTQILSPVPEPGLNPGSLAVDASGSFLLVGDFQSNQVTEYTINNPTGELNFARVTRTRVEPFSLALASGTTAVTYTPTFAYVANGLDNTISSYIVDPLTGALSSIGPPVSTASAPTPMAVDPTGSFLYVGGRGQPLGSNGTVSAYAIGNNGAVVAITSVPSGGDTFDMAIDPSGRFLYVLLGGLGISGFTIQSSGGLVSIPNSPFPVSGAFGIAVDPTGRFVYATNSDTPGWISIFTIDPVTGTLNQITNSPFFINPQGTLNGIDLDPSGRFVYAATLDVGTYGLAIDANSGALTPLPGSPFNFFPLFCSLGDIKVEPTGRFAYGSDIFPPPQVSACAIDAVSGALSVLGSFPVVSSNLSLAVDPSGRFLYVPDQAINGPQPVPTDLVSAFFIDSLSGTLSLVPGEPFPTGTLPDGIAVASRIH